MQLTKSEEQIMGYLWKLEKAYMKNILDEFSEPKPAATTVATVLKRMTDKGFVSFSNMEVTGSISLWLRKRNTFQNK